MSTVPVSMNMAASVVEGRLEGVVDGCVLGWAWSPGSPMERIWVSVFVDDEPIGLVLADLERPDLLAAGLGDGAHGFSVELPVALRDGCEHAVRVIAGRSNTPLPAVSGFTSGTSTGNAEPPSGSASFIPAPRYTATVPALEDRAQAAERLGERRAGLAEVALLAKRHGPILILGSGAFGYAVLVMIISRHFGFAVDELRFITQRWRWNADSLMDAYNGHWILMPALLYKLLFVTVGLHHTWPYRLALVLAHLACVVLVYRLALRWGVDRWVALLPAALLLVLGSSAEDLLFPFSINIVGSLAAGLGALLALSKDTHRADRWAALLLLISLATGGVGEALAIAAGAELLVSRSLRRRAWVVLVPLAIFFIWVLAYGTQQGELENALKIPSYGGEMIAAGIAALFGMSLTVGRIVLVDCVLWLGWVIVRSQLSLRAALAGLLGGLTYWTLATLARAQTFPPTTERFLYPSAVFILLAAIGFLRPVKLKPRSALISVLVVGCALLSNLNPLLEFARRWTDRDIPVMITLGAAQIAGPAGDPHYHLTHAYARLGAYLTAVRHLGSPADSVSTIIRLARENVHVHLADITILQAEQIGLWFPPQLNGATVPTVEQSNAVTLKTGARCLTATPTAANASLDLTVAPGRALYISLIGQGTVTLYARRLAANYPQQPLGTLLSTDGPRGLGFPVDASRLPWHVRLLPTTRLVTCLGATDTQ